MARTARFKGAVCQKVKPHFATEGCHLNSALRGTLLQMLFFARSAHHETLIAHMTLREALIIMSHSSLLTWLCVSHSSSWDTHCSHDFTWGAHHHESFIVAHMTLREALIIMSHSSLLTWLCVRRSSSWDTHCSHDLWACNARAQLVFCGSLSHASNCEFPGISALFAKGYFKCFAAKTEVHWSQPVTMTTLTAKRFSKQRGYAQHSCESVCQ